MTLYFSYEYKPAAYILLSVIYSALLIPIAFFSFAFLFLSSLGKYTITKSELSPDEIYSAQTIKADFGAVGGNSKVYVTPQKNLSLLVGKLQKKPMLLYSGSWRESYTTTLQWETDNILYINDKKYEIP